MISFDKVGKSINEEHHLIRSSINETLDLIKIVNKIRHLKIDNQKILCRWLSLGIIEKSKVSLDPLGTVIFTEWSDEYDSLIHDLVNLGVAQMDGRGYVTVPLMMQWYNILNNTFNTICTIDENLYEGEVINPSPMYMKLPVSKDVMELDSEDLASLVYHRLKSLSGYISGKVLYASVNVKSLGFMNQVIFRTPVDLLVMTSDNSIIAHRILDPTRTVHRGYSAAEDYLMSGFDYVVIMHRYIDPVFHERVVNDIINKPRISSIGYAAIVEDGDYLIFYKWPRLNDLIIKSRSVGLNKSLLLNSLKFMLNSQ